MTALAAWHMLLQVLCHSHLSGFNAPTAALHSFRLQLYILVPGLTTCQCYITCCRLPQGDEVMTGAARNLVQQRLKLNSNVALVTGDKMAAKPGCLSCFAL